MTMIRPKRLEYDMIADLTGTDKSIGTPHQNRKGLSLREAEVLKRLRDTGCVYIMDSNRIIWVVTDGIWDRLKSYDQKAIRILVRSKRIEMYQRIRNLWYYQITSEGLLDLEHFESWKAAHPDAVESPGGGKKQ